MYYSRRNLLWIPLIVVLTLFLLLLLGNVSRLFAQAESPAEEPSIQVTATGEVSVETDEAVISIGVETQAESASEAINQNNEQLQSLMDALTQAGIAQEQIQTQVIQLQPVYRSSSDDLPAFEETYYVARDEMPQDERIASAMERIDLAVNARSLERVPVHS